MSVDITITILNETETRFTGLNSAVQADLNRKFGPTVPGYQHTPKYKLGVWDGRICFFKSGGLTYTYLIPDILDYLEEKGYDFNYHLVDKREVHTGDLPSLIDNSIFQDIIHPEWGVPIVLRDHQVKVVNELLSNGNGIGKAATSAGKTLISAALTKAYDLVGMRVMMIVPDNGLVNQSWQDFDMVGLDTGRLDKSRKEVNKTHLITTWQSLQHRPHLMKEFDVVIVDEVHKAKSTVLNNLMVTHGKFVKFRYGITGTLPEHEVDQLSVKIAIGPLRVEVTAAYLASIGLIATPHIHIKQILEDLRPQYNQYCQDHIAANLPKATRMSYSVFRKKFFPEFKSESDYLMRNQVRKQKVVDIITNAIEERGNTLVLVNSIKYARALAKEIPNSVVVNGTDVKKAEDRQKIYDRFATEDNLTVIATVHIASTGISINRLFNIIYVDIGKSFTRVIQSIGRGLRLAAGKSSVHIIDICSDLHYNNQHTDKRMKFYDQEQYSYEVEKI